MEGNIGGTLGIVISPKEEKTQTSRQRFARSAEGPPIATSPGQVAEVGDTGMAFRFNQLQRPATTKRS